MRLRKKPWMAQALEAYTGKELLEEGLEEHKGQWSAFMGGRPIRLEIGCGKGKFLATLSGMHPDIAFLGMESQRDVCYYAVKKLREQKLDNARVLRADAAHLLDWFEPGEVDMIYLNFSDPWPKARHAKRRLTFHTFLAEYKQILKPHGHLRFKTDNDDLFDFSLEEFNNFGVQIVALTRDLHQSDILNEATTEYEDRFSGLGKNINFCEIVF
ncbi:MAG: tRNA (guanosine(46)-N7)-methyltransferase TrmB [Acidaminococcus sp.]|nr:tRNA (guanosine(46)-N7)-methyltransferase TrmB [Acidaminococcus sp.]MCI2100510.1 tRNA (guanosine(46)-N7)-methyltransferase TrmB [Acidaminococcus sp.]MCI2114829.1 tRNA (guanosine(46)-N7)-methyltransferase TrmB [Acidaminococcus sp.]MCI2116884.1 tRNA (guanosine(46)-N7)-methyltransferase TrmB [Acidaminococcus sp.]